MKTWIVLLVLLFIGLQCELWFSNNGIAAAWNLKKSISLQTQKNEKLIERNRTLQAKVEELKSGDQALEEKARNELGMARQGEVLYQIIDDE